MTTRSDRRHQAARAKARAARMLARLFCCRRDWTGDDAARLVGKRARTATPCSCWLCGNPRRWFGKRTRAEEVGP